MKLVMIISGAAQKRVFDLVIIALIAARKRVFDRASVAREGLNVNMLVRKVFSLLLEDQKGKELTLSQRL